MTRERVYPRELTCCSVRVRRYQRRISSVPPAHERRRRGFACRPCSHRCEAADPKHLGARIGATAVLHSWGSAMTHHPHVHMILPGGGISLDDTHWVSCRPGFFLPVRVLSRLFRRLFLSNLLAGPPGWPPRVLR